MAKNIFNKSHEAKHFSLPTELTTLAEEYKYLGADSARPLYLENSLNTDNSWR